MKKNILFFFLTFLFFTSCKDNAHFRVEGNIEGAKEEMLYLEKLSIPVDDAEKVDSVKLRKNGNFAFKVKRPGYQEYYRIRLNDKSIVFGIDSTETVQIEAKDPNFENFTISGSESIEKIHQLNESVRKLEKAIKEYDRYYDSGNEEIVRQKQAELNAMLAEHTALSQNIIKEDTRSNAAYYTVFHKVNGMYVFDIANDEDLKYYASVASAYNVFYPHSFRGKHITTVVMQAKRLKQSQKLKEALLKNNAQSEINISLPNADGKEITLSSLKGKVVLVNFSYYNTEFSLEYIYALRELYQKYAKQGFEIYGISFDDYDFFKSTAVNFPWVRVYDKNGLSSPLFQQYDVSQLPTLFLLDRNGNLVSRHIYVDDALKTNLEELMKEK